MKVWCSNVQVRITPPQKRRPLTQKGNSALQIASLSIHPESKLHGCGDLAMMDDGALGEGG